MSQIHQHREQNICENMCLHRQHQERQYDLADASNTMLMMPTHAHTARHLGKRPSSGVRSSCSEGYVSLHASLEALALCGPGPPSLRCDWHHTTRCDGRSLLGPHLGGNDGIRALQA